MRSPGSGWDAIILFGVNCFIVSSPEERGASELLLRGLRVCQRRSHPRGRVFRCVENVEEKRSSTANASRAAQAGHLKGICFSRAASLAGSETGREVVGWERGAAEGWKGFDNAASRTASTDAGEAFKSASPFIE